MAFAEASYSAQNSEDPSSSALHPDLDSVTQPNHSSSGHRELLPPDLYAPLNIIPLTPPPSEHIRHQSLRFPDDLYTRKAFFWVISSSSTLLFESQDMLLEHFAHSTPRLTPQARLITRILDLRK